VAILSSLRPLRCRNLMMRRSSSSIKVALFGFAQFMSLFCPGKLKFSCNPSISFSYWWAQFGLFRRSRRLLR
jgi:hypothetical protein